MRTQPSIVGFADFPQNCHQDSQNISGGTFHGATQRQSRLGASLQFSLVLVRNKSLFPVPTTSCSTSPGDTFNDCITTIMRRAGPLAASDTFILASSDEGENGSSSQGWNAGFVSKQEGATPSDATVVFHHLCGHVPVSPELGRRFFTLHSPPGCCSHGQQPRP